MAESMRELLESALQDTLSAERQALEGMESMLDAASAQSLRTAIQQHMQETERQIERLERVFGMLDMEEEGNTCEGMQGLIEETEEQIDEMEAGALLDVALVAAAQKIEHYEIAAYGTLCALLKACGQQEACDLLAQTLRRHPRLQGLPVKRPPQTMRATVLGAASQTVTLSGSTIWAEQALLPLRNLPVIRPHLTAEDLHAGRLAEAILYAMRRWDVEPGAGHVAIALDLPVQLDFTRLQAVAGGIVAYAAAHLPPGWPVILIIERDYAQSLGQTIKALRPDLPVVAIDQVGLGEGDFIDIGLPMLDGRVVPLSVKTLVFYR